MPYQKQKSESYSAAGGINIKASLYATNVNEQLNILNFDFRVPGSLMKRYGSTEYIGASVAGLIGGIFEFSQLTGQSYIVVTANTNAYTINTGNFVAFRSGLLNNGIFDFVPFVDRLFMANGQDFFKTDGTSTNSSFFSLPPGQSVFPGFSNGTSNIPSFGITAGLGGGLSGNVYAAYGYLNERGYFGPGSDFGTSAVLVMLDGVTFGSVDYYDLSFPPGYGITAYAFYRSDIDQVALYGTTQIPVGTTTMWLDNGPISFVMPEPEYLWFTMAPKFLELYNNQLFLAGFSSALSTVYWSDIGEPEGILPEFFAEFRTNDGDVVTGLKAYANTLMVTKQRSTLQLTGTDPTNFAINQISDQFGCISNRAMISYNDVCEWLDTKGIVQYNGANIAFTSNRVENFFLRMNLTAAYQQAQAVHFRDLNEVWWAIPIDGSLVNNCVIVYDYLIQAWTVFQGFNPSSLAIVRGIYPINTMLYGGYNGTIYNFGASLAGDNGAGITCSVQTRFLAPMGQSMEQQFRRVYLNLDPIAGSSQAIQVDLIPDYGTSIAQTYTMYQDPFQSRLEFGLPAKAMAMQFTHVSATLPIKINGWTVESRFQRAV